MAKVGKILIWIAVVALWECSTKYEEVAPDTELSVTVENQSGQPLDGADVYVYDDLGAFTQTAATGTPNGFVSTAKTVLGTVVINKLPWNKQLFIYAAYQDNAIFPGTYVTLDNSDENFSLKNLLTRGSATSLHVVLKPADGFITFWTGNTNSVSLPIDVFLGSNPGGTLTQPASSPPGLFQTGGLTMRTRKGKISFEGKSTAGCLWTDQVAIAGAQSVTYQLSDCVVGTIAFYTDNTNGAKLPITLTLNANDAIPNISAPVSIIPIDCSAVNLAVAYRVPGNYTYQAISASGACVWSSVFSLTANECKLIYLSTCP